ncbi:MAG: hypothetical protein IKE21_01895 [Erysipelotrichaceae bacterium]|nr:hypothetical protein [Erysipelotrichaceae bacterium]
MGGDPSSPVFNAAFLSYGLITGCCQLGAVLVFLGGLGILLKLFVQANKDI